MGGARHAERRPGDQRRWVGMAVLAWSTIRRYADLAGSFASASFKHLPNPFAETICNRAQADASPRLADDRGVHVHVSRAGGDPPRLELTRTNDFRAAEAASCQARHVLIVFVLMIPAP